MVGHEVVQVGLVEGQGRGTCAGGGGLRGASGQGRGGVSGAGLRGQRACGRGSGLGPG